MAEADQKDMPQLAIRRHTDNCFLEVEQRVPGGYIVEGMFIGDDEVADVHPIDDELYDS